MKHKNNTKTLSLDEELMMCCAYRYAIGRHTYVSSLANYIAKEYYNRLSDERLSFTSEDIKKTITDCLQYGGCSIHYDGTINYNERDGLGDLLTWMKLNIKSEKDFANIDHIEVYKESYSSDAPKKYRVYTANPTINKYHSQMDINDLLNWYTLSKVFDKSAYKVLHVKNGKLEDDIVAVQTWRQSTTEIEDKPGYYKFVSWSWDLCWVSVDEFIKKGEYAGYIPNEYIIKISNYTI